MDNGGTPAPKATEPPGPSTGRLRLHSSAAGVTFEEAGDVVDPVLRPPAQPAVGKTLPVFGHDEVAASAAADHRPVLEYQLRGNEHSLSKTELACRLLCHWFFSLIKGDLLGLTRTTGPQGPGGGQGAQEGRRPAGSRSAEHLDGCRAVGHLDTWRNGRNRRRLRRRPGRGSQREQGCGSRADQARGRQHRVESVGETKIFRPVPYRVGGSAPRHPPVLPPGG